MSLQSYSLEKKFSLERESSLGYEDCPILALGGHLKVSQCWGWTLSFIAIGRAQLHGACGHSGPGTE